MQPFTLKHAIIGAVILITALLLFSRLDGWIKKGDSEPVPATDYSALYKSTKVRLDQSEKARAELKDTLFGLQTEKGFLEVELNKVRRDFEDSKTGYTKAKDTKDTAKAIQICDSIVYNVVPIYMALDSSIHDGQIKIDRITDTLLLVTEKSSASKDTLITAANGEIKRLKKGKRNLWVALGSAVVACIVFLSR